MIYDYITSNINIINNRSDVFILFIISFSVLQTILFPYTPKPGLKLLAIWQAIFWMEYMTMSIQVPNDYYFHLINTEHQNSWHVDFSRIIKVYVIWLYNIWHIINYDTATATLLFVPRFIVYSLIHHLHLMISFHYN